MNRFPEISVLKWIAKEVLPFFAVWAIIFFAVWGVFYGGKFLLDIAPVVYEAFQPWWLLYFAAAYAASVLVRLVR